MARRKTFSRTIVRNVFRLANPAQNYNPYIWRRDKGNKLICLASYGDRNSSYGWNIHHIDGNKNNNRETNLIALHYDTHALLHENQ